MANLMVDGRLCGVTQSTTEKGTWVRFGVKEPEYKNTAGETVKPFWNFILKADSPTAKFILNYKDRIDVVKVTALMRMQQKDNKTEYYVNNVKAEVITWKAVEKSADTGSATSESVEQAVPETDESATYPWAN